MRQTIFDVRLYTTDAVLAGFTALTDGDVDTKTWAMFGDFTYDFTDQFSVSLGGRYTSDKRHATIFRAEPISAAARPSFGGSPAFGVRHALGATTSNFDGKRTDTAFTPRASVSFKPNADHNLYASYSQGFKGGGFDPRGQSTPARPTSTATASPTPTKSTSSWRSSRRRSTATSSAGRARCSNRRLQLGARGVPRRL